MPGNSRSRQSLIDGISAPFANNVKVIASSLVRALGIHVASKSLSIMIGNNLNLFKRFR
jgi:hypothetical protein